MIVVVGCSGGGDGCRWEMGEEGVGGQVVDSSRSLEVTRLGTNEIFTQHLACALIQRNNNNDNNDSNNNISVFKSACSATTQ
jgi:hypothetical protein